MKNMKVVKCPKDGIAYKKAKTSFGYHGVIMPNVQCFKCPKCGETLLP